MTDTPGLPSAIGIEAVELVSEGGAGVTLRVTGRWRRRRPEWVGPAMLVVEVEGRRQRIPAMPEPPSLTGTLPGTWRMSFSVPPELVGALEGRTWLQLGAVMAPLSLPPRGEAGSRPAIDPELLAERELLSYEFAVESARRRAREADLRVTQLEGEVGRLEAELEEVRREPERLWAVIGERERALRLARQQVHAETMLREELEARLGEQERAMERLRERARRLGEREGELEGELRSARREADEARHAAVAARAVAAAVPAAAVAQTVGRPRGRPPDRGRGLADEVGLAEAARSAASAPRAAPVTGLPRRLGDALGVELVLVAARLSPRRGVVSLPAAPEPPPVASEPPPIVREPAPAEPPPELAAVIRTLEAELESTREALALERDAARAELAQEREARGAAEARIGVLEEDLARQRERSGRALRLIVEFRRELEELRAPGGSAAPVPEPEAAAAPVPEPEAAPAPVPEPEAAPAPVPEPAPAPAPETPVTPPAEPSVEPSRLSAALERLREQHPPADAAGESATGARAAGALPGTASDAVPRLFRSLLREDPAAAGRLVIGLLPAQRLVDPRPVAYDLVLGPDTCLRVTVGSGAPEIELTTTPRTAASTQFRIEGDPAALARLLGAGSLRRRLGWGGRLAKATGDKGAVAALRALTNTPLRPQQLREAGVELEPSLVLRLLAVLAEADPLASPFTLAHRTPAGATTATLHVQPGGRAAVTATGLEPPAGTTVTCPPPRLLDALLGDRSGDVEVSGDERPLALVRQWLERA